MESKLTQTAQQAVAAASQRLDSEERVSAFMAHIRMMVALYKAAQQPAGPVGRLTSRRR